MPQNEVQGTVPVLDDTGAPQNFGWSRRPDFSYDSALAWAPRRRFSESDRYIVFNPTHTVIFEVRDDGYLGYMGISVVSVKDKKRSTQGFQSFLPLGAYEMPLESVSGAVRYRRKKIILDFVSMEGGVKIIKADIPHFGRSRRMRGELVLTEPPLAESLACNLPWEKDRNAFRYSLCSPWYTVEGVIQFGNAEIVFAKDSAWGILDWNRSIRPRADLRYWASACGLSGGRLVGFTVGHGLIDSSAASENAFFVDGRIHKLDEVSHSSSSGWLSPWRFTDSEKRLDMVFSPLQARTDRRQMLFYSMSRRQVYGSFSGKVILDDGAEMNFHHITGFAERCKTRF
jgi:hypothetical protein